MFPQVDLHCYERSMFSHRFYVTDCDGAAADLTGYEARLELRRSHAPSPEDTEEPEEMNTLLAAYTSDDKLTVGAGGHVDLTWTGADTEEIGDTYGPVLLYDLFVYPADAHENAIIIARGYVVTRKNVTIPEAPVEE